MNSQPVSVSAPAPFLSRAVIVIPALNEARCVEGVVRSWRQRGVGSLRIVDNGSNDQTAAIAAAAGAVVLVEPQRGYGAAAWRGTRDLPAAIEWIIFGSADGSDLLDDAAEARFQAAIDAGADFVLGERVSFKESRRHLTAVQRFGNALGCVLVMLGWGRWFRDMGSLRAIRSSAFARLALKDRAFGWNVEMQVRAIESGLRIAEVPVRYYPRAAGDGKISGSPLGVVRAGWGILSMITRLWLARGPRRSSTVARASA